MAKEDMERTASQIIREVIRNLDELDERFGIAFTWNDGTDARDAAEEWLAECDTEESPGILESQRSMRKPR